MVDETKGPRFRINNNGDTADTIKVQYEAVYRAANKLGDALQELGVSALHGRNYQTCGDDRMEIARGDQDAVRIMRAAAQEIEDFAIAGVVSAIKQREDL